MQQKEMLSLIEKISPHARDYVYENFSCVEVLYSIFDEQNKGIFLKVDNADCCIFFAYFQNENNIEEVIEMIKNKSIEDISKAKSKELCFNVHGSNEKIINLVRSLGFKIDMEGYHLEFSLKKLPNIINCNLIEKGFEDFMLNEFVDLFDSAYYQLNIDNKWEINSYASNKEQFKRRLNTLNTTKQVRSFWLEGKLIGSYIFEQNYITDIVVNPSFQNKGYGRDILLNCIRNMRLNKAINSIRLRVAKSNTGAKKLYLKNGFVEIANFAEHTYR